MILRTINGYENYKISDSGEVFNTKTNKQLKQQEKKGYMNVSLFKKGKKKNELVHRLVAKAFIPNPYNYPQINHKDENPKNNNASNLEWCTAKYNANYGTHGEKIRKRKVIINGKEYESITKAMEELKIGTKKIYQLLKEENNG